MKAVALNVLSSLPPSPRREQVASHLRRLDVGQVRFSAHDCGLYSTDASLYQAVPLGVVVPGTVDQASRLVTYCAANHVPLLPRGGGTSLAGQAVADDAIVLDLSAFCRAVLNLDVDSKTVTVEPGISPDELNRQLGGTGLFFAADPATVAQAAIGGCIGNNAAGSRSIRYGRTSENLAGVEILLSTGERAWMEPGAGRRSDIALRLAAQVIEITRQVAEQVRARFPKTVRRNAGYGLDLILDQLDREVAADDLDLSGLICGSEGTLALVTAARLKLHPLPLARTLAVISFNSVESAVDAVGPILRSEPSAVELLDDVVLSTARNNTVCRPYVDLLPRAAGGLDPAAVLYVEYQAEQSLDEIDAKFAQLRGITAGAPMNTYREPAEMDASWTLRKSGEALLHGLASHRKPVTFVEDNAVPVEQLPRFVREFKRIVANHGTTAAYWAHASVGVLHVRPMLDLHDEDDLGRLRSIAQQVADLARDCGGVMSGEHGDGRARGPLLRQFFGDELMAAFGKIKAVFDPVNLFNPGNITGAGPVESITQQLRVQANVVPSKDVDAVETFFDYADQAGFDEAVERCNGAGFCRKTAGGTMCPSYRATLDERHSTRGRGNALRLAITGQTAASGKPKWNDADTMATLDLCLSCKACKTECPSNVDLSRLKAEYTAQRYARFGTPMAVLLFGHVRTLNRMGSLAPTLANAVARFKPLKAMIIRVMKLDARRSLPAFGPSLYGWFGRRKPLADERPRVVLYADCFTAYTESHIGRATVRVLESLGYEVLLPKIGCCGRAMISTGLLPDAIAAADRALDVLLPLLDDKRIIAVVVPEPSCLSAIKDDWLQLKLTHDIERRRKLAAIAMLPEQFVSARWDEHPVRPATTPVGPVVLHGHCHQKALWGDDTSAAALRQVSAEVDVLPSGCCGMAGAFGFQAGKYELSMKIGELSVFPPVRSAGAHTLIAAPGSSCRHQIHDATGREALHPMEILARALGCEGD